MQFVVYGDFNCPFSAVAARRAAVLEEAGEVTVDWRAVQHDPAIPRAGQPVEGALAAELDREIAQISQLLAPGESLGLRRPPVRPHTGPATAAYASTPSARAAEARAMLFAAYWMSGRDIGQHEVLVELGVEPPAAVPASVERWQAEWADVDRPMVPLMRLPDGTVSRGLGVLERLKPGQGPGVRSSSA